MKDHLTEREQVMNHKTKCHAGFIIVSIFLMVVVPLSEARKSSTNASLTNANQKVFNAYGGYEVFGELPKGFEGVSRLLVFRSVGRSKPRFPSALQTIINPSTGNIVEYKLIASVITRNKFTFTTASIHDVSYRFEGRFLFDRPDQVDNRPSIEGQLSKYQNGTKVAEGKIAFTACACVE